MTQAQALELNKFWFGEGDLNDPEYLNARMKIWFGKAPELDAKIKGTYAAWLGAGSVNENELQAEILLHDQIPRNAFRDQAKMFAYDAAALELTRKALLRGLHKSLHPIEAVFLLLPLEHSENIENQDFCVRLMEESCARADKAIQPVMEGTLNFSRRHREVIRTFGRFPHRNHILGRESSPEEVAFLKQPGSRF